MTDIDVAVRDALETAGPPVDHHPDWGDVVGRSGPAVAAARRRRITGGVATGVVLCGLAALIGALLVAAPDSSTTVPAAPAALAVLDTPPATSDRLPAWLVADGTVQALGVKPVTARRALTSGPVGVWVARSQMSSPTSGPGGTGGRSTVAAEEACLVDVRLSGAPPPAGRGPYGPGGAGGVSCVTRTDLAGHVLTSVIAQARSTPGPVVGDVAGLVPDGYDTVTIDGRSFPVTRNVFLARAVDLAAAPVVTGPSGSITALPSRPSTARVAAVIPPGTPRFGVFTRPARGEDRLPEPLVELFAIRARRGSKGPQPLQARPPYLAGARYVGSVNGRRYWLVPNRPATIAWVASLYPDGNRTIQGQSLPGNMGLGWTVTGASFRPLQKARYNLAAVVPDGYTRVTIDGVSKPITDNWVVFQNLPEGAGAVEATGPAGTLRQQIPLEHQDAPPRVILTRP